MNGAIEYLKIDRVSGELCYKRKVFETYQNKLAKKRSMTPPLEPNEV